MSRKFKTSLSRGTVLWSGITSQPYWRRHSSEAGQDVYYVIMLVAPYARTSYTTFNETTPVPFLRAAGIKVEDAGEGANPRFRAIGCEYVEVAASRWESVSNRYTIPTQVLDFYSQSSNLTNEHLELIMQRFEEPAWTLGSIREGIGIESPVPEEEGWIAL